MKFVVILLFFVFASLGLHAQEAAPGRAFIFPVGEEAAVREFLPVSSQGEVLNQIEKAFGTIPGLRLPFDISLPSSRISSVKPNPNWARFTFALPPSSRVTASSAGKVVDVNPTKGFVTVESKTDSGKVVLFTYSGLAGIQVAEGSSVQVGQLLGSSSSLELTIFSRDRGDTGSRAGAREPAVESVDLGPFAGKLVLPYDKKLPGVAITSNFNLAGRVHPITGQRRAHSGTDIGMPMGTQLYASGDGRVSFANARGGYGNYICIEHGTPVAFTSCYGHLSEISVKEGQLVKRGQPIGRVGSTGWSTGPHLHFEILKGIRDQRQFIDAMHVVDQSYEAFQAARSSAARTA